MDDNQLPEPRRAPEGSVWGGSTARQVVRAVEWILARGDHVDERMWAEVYDVMCHSRSPRTRLIAARIFADRIDPAPRGPIITVAPTQVNVTWQAPSPSSSPTLPDPSSNGFTIAFDGGTASSATDDSANP
jgi:hypothetical protein